MDAVDYLLFAAHLFFKAATILALPSGDNLRLPFFAGLAAGAGVDVPLIFAHLARAAAAILAFAAADIVFFPATGAGAENGDGSEPPPRILFNRDSSAAISSLMEMASFRCSMEMDVVMSGVYKSYTGWSI